MVIVGGMGKGGCGIYSCMFLAAIRGGIEGDIIFRVVFSFSFTLSFYYCFFFVLSCLSCIVFTFCLLSLVGVSGSGG